MTRLHNTCRSDEGPNYKRRREVVAPSALVLWLAGLILSTCLANAQIVETKITPSDGLAGSRFGWSLAIQDNYLIVGALYDDNENGRAGCLRQNLQRQTLPPTLVLAVQSVWAAIWPL